MHGRTASDFLFHPTTPPGTLEDNEVTPRWALAHQDAPGNEKADEHAKATADGDEPRDAVPDSYRWETGLSHMVRAATEARARTTAQWIAESARDPDEGTAPRRGEASDASMPDEEAGRRFTERPGHGLRSTAEPRYNTDAAEAVLKPYDCC